MSHPPANREITRQQLTQHQQSQAFYHDRHARQLRPLAPGDPITVKNPITSKWDRAFVVSRSDKPHSYIIQTEGGGPYRRNRRHLRPRSFEARNTPAAPDTMAIQHREPILRIHRRHTKVHNYPQYNSVRHFRNQTNNIKTW